VHGRQRNDFIEEFGNLANHNNLFGKLENDTFDFSEYDAKR